MKRKSTEFPFGTGFVQSCRGLVAQTCRRRLLLPCDDLELPLLPGRKDVMERRTLFLIAAAIVALASLGGAFCVWAFAPDELEEKAELVQRGMTKDQVEAILGKPPVPTIWVWSSDRTLVMMEFDRNGKLSETVVERTPLWDRIRERLPFVQSSPQDVAP